MNSPTADRLLRPLADSLGDDSVIVAFLTGLVDLTGQLMPKLFWAGVTLLGTRWLAIAGQQLGRRVLARVEPTLKFFLVQLIGIGIWLVGAIGALSSMGFETTSLVAILGTAGLAVGLALQNSLSHLAAGIMLIGFRPFEVGDSIESQGISGDVESIGLFSTTVVSGDNTRITIPNNNLLSNVLKNHTALGKRRIDLKVNIGDRPVVNTIEQLVAAVGAQVDLLPEPPVKAIVTHLRQDAVIVSVRAWCRSSDYDRLKAELLAQVREVLVRSN